MFRKISTQIKAYFTPQSPNDLQPFTTIYDLENEDSAASAASLNKAGVQNEQIYKMSEKTFSAAANKLTDCMINASAGECQKETHAFMAADDYNAIAAEALLATLNKKAVLAKNMQDKAMKDQAEIQQEAFKSDVKRQALADSATGMSHDMEQFQETHAKILRSLQDDTKKLLDCIQSGVDCDPLIETVHNNTDSLSSRLINDFERIQAGIHHISATNMAVKSQSKQLNQVDKKVRQLAAQQNRMSTECLKTGVSIYSNRRHVIKQVDAMEKMSECLLPIVASNIADEARLTEQKEQGFKNDLEMNINFNRLK